MLKYIIGLQNFKNFQTKFQSFKTNSTLGKLKNWALQCTKLQIKDMRIQNKIIKIMYNINR